MKKLKNNSGITMVALVITIIVIMIISTISINSGTQLIKKAKIESLITNMITIKSNAKIYAEEINAEVWDLNDSEKRGKIEELFGEKYSMYKYQGDITEKIDNDILDSNTCEAYSITVETLEKMGLTDLANNSKNGEFVVVYSLNDYTKLEIVYPDGVKYDKSTYWTLTSLKNKLDE